MAADHGSIGHVEGRRDERVQRASATTVDSGATLDSALQPDRQFALGRRTVTNSGPGPPRSQPRAASTSGVIEDGCPRRQRASRKNSVGNTLTERRQHLHRGHYQRSTRRLIGKHRNFERVFLPPRNLRCLERSRRRADKERGILGGQAGKSVSTTIFLRSRTARRLQGVIDDGGAGGSLVVAADADLAGKNTTPGDHNQRGNACAVRTGSISNSSGVYIATGATFDISQTTAGASIQTLAIRAGQAGAVKLGAQTLTIVNGSPSAARSPMADRGGTRLARHRRGHKPSRERTPTPDHHDRRRATLKGGATDAFSPFSAMTCKPRHARLGGYDQAFLSFRGRHCHE